MNKKGLSDKAILDILKILVISMVVYLTIKIIQSLV